MNSFASNKRAWQTFLLALSALFVTAVSAEGRGALTGTPQIQPELRISYTLGSLANRDVEVYRHPDLWGRIRTGFKMDEVNPDLVRAHEDWYRRHPATLQRALERSRVFLYHIVDEVEKRGMPMEIALLPAIESAFNPLAVSPRKASGMWQFIASTGRIYGLKQSTGYDGRRDVLEATRAALDYLEDLYAMFGRWDLALGAYNCGEGCMGRALGRSATQSDYARLRLPTETKHYVPKLLAVRNIVQEPERYGVVLEDVANEPYFMQVSLNRHMEARQVASLAEISVEEVFTLNPGYRGQILRSDHTGVLLLPTDRVETFQANLKRQDKARTEGTGPAAGLGSYSARKGELLKDIASKFGVSIQWLKSRNALNLYKGKLSRPATLVVPAETKAEKFTLTGLDRDDRRIAKQDKVRGQPAVRGES